MQSLNVFVRDDPARSLIVVPNGESRGLVLVLENIANTNKCSVSLVSSENVDLKAYRQLNGKSVYGCLGLVQVGEDVFVALATDVAKVGSIEDKPVYRILAVQFLSLTTDRYDIFFTNNGYGANRPSTSTSSSNSSIASASMDPTSPDYIEHPAATFQKILSLGSFYFSTNLDLTKSLQRRTSEGYLDSSLFDIADDHFWWNKHMLSSLLTIRSKELTPEERKLLDNSGLIILAIQGYVGISDIRVAGDSVKLAIISRLSCKRAGTRYNARGISDEGYVANFVETEFVLSTKQLSFSHVQVRGSVPLFWEQTGIQIGHKIEIARGMESTAPAVKKHFGELMDRYGDIHVVDLLGQRESSNEYILTCEYQSHIRALRDLGVSIGYTSFDFHAMIKGNNLDNLLRLATQVRNDILHTGYFASASDSGQKISSQMGTFRTNCLDCLDRTNVVQTLLARQALEIFLKKHQPTLALAFTENTVQSVVSTLWGDNGDWISRIYAGTGALKSHITRNGKQSILGFLDDAAKTVNRFVINNFQDKGRQEAIDVILGKKLPIKVLLVQNPLHEAVSEEMTKRIREYSVYESVTAFIGTWNVNGKVPGPTDNLLPFLESGTSPTPDIYAFGLQEMVEMTANAIINADTAVLKLQWQETLLKAVNRDPKTKYILVRSQHLVGIALFVFVKSEHAPHIRNVQMGIKKTGLGGMAGNKGGVALSFNFNDTSVCLLTAHLAAGNEYIDRNKDYWTITNGLNFKGRMLRDHEIVIWFGDFNYRVALPNETARAAINSGQVNSLLENDQLLQQKAHGAIFDEYEEGPIHFLPTYKYDNGTDIYDTSEKARTPSWTDRILFRGPVMLEEYSRSELRISDHKPVRGFFKLKTVIINKEAKDRIEKEVYAEKAHLFQSPIGARPTVAGQQKSQTFSPPLPPRNGTKTPPLTTSSQSQVQTKIRGQPETGILIDLAFDEPPAPSVSGPSKPVAPSSTGNEWWNNPRPQPSADVTSATTNPSSTMASSEPFQASCDDTQDLFGGFTGFDTSSGTGWTASIDFDSAVQQGEQSSNGRISNDTTFALTEINKELLNLFDNGKTGARMENGDSRVQ